MKRVEFDGQLYAMLVSPLDDKPEIGSTAWVGSPAMSLQGSLMHYAAGHEFRNHRHKLNPRIVKRTQECFIVVRGLIQVSIAPDRFLHDDEILEAGPGEAIFIWGGFHGLKVVEEGTLFYEVKAGSFDGNIDDDKEFL
jgi:mannose-6-phosphate isomerase-like protein (cupin superfamily)